MKKIGLGEKAKMEFSVVITLPKSCIDLKAYPKKEIELTEDEFEFALTHGLKALVDKQFCYIAGEETAHANVHANKGTIEVANKVAPEKVPSKKEEKAPEVRPVEVKTDEAAPVLAKVDEAPRPEAEAAVVEPAVEAPPAEEVAKPTEPVVEKKRRNR